MSYGLDVYVEDAVTEMQRPQRSRLFALDPIGIGTSDCEGLISYLERLARAHSVETRLLIRSEFDRYCGHLGGMRYANFFDDRARTIHGTGTYAETFADAAAALTMREDMGFLTMLPWRGVVPAIGNGLVARYPKWCKACLCEVRESREGVYFPLAWYLELSTVCQRHGGRLSDRCPWCQRLQPLIPSVPYLDRCAHCNGWLGTESRIGHQQAPERWESWLAEAIGDMIAHGPDAGRYATGEVFREILSRYVELHANGEKGAFSRAMGMTKTSVSCWITKRQKPLLPQFLNLCQRLGMMPSEFFRMPAGTAEPQRADVPMPRRLHRIEPKFGSRMPEKSAIGRVLERILADAGDCRPMSGVANALGTTRGYLNYWFRASCLAISARHKKHLNLLARKKRTIHQNEVRNATFRIYLSGIYPSKRKVHQAIRPLKLSLQMPELRAAHKKALKELQG